MDVLIPAGTMIRPDDRGVLYGEGVFETLLVEGGRARLRAAHLARMARSAALLGIPLPDPAPLVDEAERAWPEGEGALRLVCTAGPAGGEPVLYATVSSVPPAVIAQRATGVRVVTAEAGVSHRRPAWSLTTAKTISYAANLAARRARAEEMLWISTEGYALESPTAGLVWLADGAWHGVAGGGVLPSVTAAAILSEIGGNYSSVTVPELHRSDGAWLVSALRGVAEVTELDGRERARSPWTGRLQEIIGRAGA
ncbi:aminotransferase class IV [Actinoplanes sp. NBRC 103695]|uniref:aminotransferase class IV n=1 Tax=Actinoplanes sp. NBRC 103695 TaxID=3032202 RepID=UPI0024A16649|nr:aminotransferase class IV [Actinoplanes sp. NBRC 103695]GLY96913.1 4-amino-4-deoxychorismate lyase [Actinoplanes sp. NBRC 103695]